MKDPEKSERRAFLKKGLSLGLAAGGSFLLGRPGHLFGNEPVDGPPDLVAVRNGEPDVLFSKGIELMGGIKKYVKKNQTIVIKPNIGFAKEPEIGATTNPLLIKTIAEHCFHAGAKKVYVFDHVAVSNGGLSVYCYEKSGIEHAARSAGALVVPAEDLKYYQKVKIPGGKQLRSARVHELILESDVFFNVPVLKDHRYTFLSVAMKNLMGVVWDRMAYHNSNVDQCIADFCLFGKPDLNIVDAYRVMVKNGPRGNSPNDVVLKKTLLISRDIVAVDAAATKIFGRDPNDMDFIKMGHKLKVGNMNLNELNIRKHVISG